MGTHHDHSHAHPHAEKSLGNIKVAFWLNSFFALMEIFGGFYTNSVAILSDALHDLGDSLSLGIAYYFQKKSRTRRDSVFSYGYKRFSLIGAFVNAIVLAVGSGFVIVEAVKRLFDPQTPDAKGMIVFALLGIVFNLLAMLRLKKGSSINEKVVSLHFLEDVLGWVAVLTGSVIMVFFEVPVLDPILSLLIALFILYNIYGNLKSALRIVLQGIPVDVSEKEILARLGDVKEIGNVHDLHIWTMDGSYNVLTLHAVVRSSMTVEETEKIKNEIRSHLSDLNIQHATIEIEVSNAHCNLDEC